MGRRAAALALILALAPVDSPGAQPLDPTVTDALATTLRMLLDPSLRSAASAGNPQAAAAEEQLRA